MTVDLYANYGLLTHEKETFYTIGCPHYDAVCSELVTVKIPDEWIVGETVLGALLVCVDGMDYYAPLQKVLGNIDGDAPAIVWFDGKRRRHVELQIVNDK